MKPLGKEKIECVSCYECGGTDVSYSESNLNPFVAWCWECQNYVAVIIRTVENE